MKQIFLSIIVLLAIITKANSQEKQGSDCRAGWMKYENNPILGGHLGTIFDVQVVRTDAGMFQMYCSWRNERSIAISESKDGLKWSKPVICLNQIDTSSWEQDVTRPYVIIKDGMYHIWYTGHRWQKGGAAGYAAIGYATSKDGKNWNRYSANPVMVPEGGWEKTTVICPMVLWDEKEQLFKMWFSGGEVFEPDAIGYATSKDGIHWVKDKNNPILRQDSEKWEQNKVTACQVIKRKNDYLMFYIGFENPCLAQIGMARSKDGITNWERYKDNPIIRLGDGWDSESVYKPYAIPDPENNRWLIYFNARRKCHEQMGMAIHEGMDLGF